MKTSLKKVFTFIVDHSLYFYLALLMIMLGIFANFYSGQRALLNYYEQARTSQRLSVMALFLSEENYHTQLEIYEVFSSPDENRIRDFHAHEKMLEDQIQATYQAFSENQDHVDAETLSDLQSLKKAFPKIQDQWTKFLTAAKKKHPTQEQIRLLWEAEKIFDEENFNGRIKHIVNKQLESGRFADQKTKEIHRNNALTTLIGILSAFFLTFVVMLLHRAALRGKAQALQLVQAGKLASLGQLSAGMAHELNSPLMFIKGYNNRVKSTLLKKNYDSGSDIWEYLKEVDSGVERISKIVNHFRDFSRLSQNELQPVRINDIIQRSFILFDEQLRLNEISLEIDLDPTNPLVLADANRLEQVFLNLISNARDALSAADRKTDIAKSIFVKTKVQDQDVIISIADTGTGIHEKNLSRIFDPFFTTKPVGVGTGLGLSISTGIIRDHHGKIEVESELGKGTQFTITLPGHSY